MRNERALLDAVPRNPRGIVHHEGTERQEQKALFRWLADCTVIEPRLAMAFAVPNGGHRDERVAAQMKGEGVKPGVPDICLPVPSGSFHGLFLELKVGKNDATALQREWLQALHEQGYAVTVQHGYLNAAAAVVEYLIDPEGFVSGL